MTSDKDFGLHAVCTAEKTTITIGREWLGSFLAILYNADKRLAVYQAHHDEHGNYEEASARKLQRELVDAMTEVVADAIMYGVPKKSPSENNA